ncbi:helix-turn-helix domain-containing protein [Desulfovibrio sp. ZJ369]|uniref:helix-turn-helix domain-containing protein n=1 Tax=Desulfovibrio sp. ZJ369 TaxID=2709793 RepID=UPI0013EA8D7A|nr:helix-turn-helix domain-containing protein [Desulfovibrio sp. ZJ369]
MTEIPLPYGTPPETDFDAQYRRLLAAAGCATQMELADFLEIRHSAVADARRRKLIPSDWLLILLDKKGINPDWIRLGKGGMLLEPGAAGAANPAGFMMTESRPVGAYSTDELLAELARRILKNVG